MKIIKPSVEILFPNTDLLVHLMEQIVEYAGRTCYKSNAKMDDKSAAGFISRLIRDGHEAMLEHACMTVKFTVDRGVSHEIVRHRVASFAQESTRYCNYSQDKFGNELTFIKPCFFEPETPACGNAFMWDEEKSTQYEKWLANMSCCETVYLSLLKHGAKPEEARTVLPNSLKTELVMTANMREWRHFFKLRALGTTGKPHPQMKEVAVMLLKQCKKMGMVFFDDLEVPE